MLAHAIKVNIQIITFASNAKQGRIPATGLGVWSALERITKTKPGKAPANNVQAGIVGPAQVVPEIMAAQALARLASTKINPAAV